jgi:NhaP-type Na+/H+ or K+/H+ antiporter
MDLIKTVSNFLGVVCIAIGVLLIPLCIWFLRPAIKNKDRASLVAAILVLALAAACFIGAYMMFTTGIIQQAPM